MEKNSFYLLRTYRNDVLIKHETIIFLNKFEDDDGIYYRFKSLSDKNSYHNRLEKNLHTFSWKPEKDQSVIWKTILTKK